MAALNPNNPNGGGKGDSSMSQIVPSKVTVASPDNQPSVSPLGGPSFLPGNPAGREANPKPKVVGGNPILT